MPGDSMSCRGMTKASGYVKPWAYEEAGPCSKSCPGPVSCWQWVYLGESSSGEPLWDEAGTMNKNRGQQNCNGRELLAKTKTASQHPQPRQLFSLSLFAALSHIKPSSGVLNPWSQSLVSDLLLRVAFWRLRLIRQMSMRQLHCYCTAILSPRL